MVSWALTIAVYSAAALVYFVLPIGSRWNDALLGTALFAPDAILNAGILEWGYQSLWAPSRHVFDWTAGFPLDNTLASTENLIGWQIVYSPLRGVGLGPVATYNVLIVSSYIISGIGAALLARRLGANRYGAAISGFVFAFVPFHLNHSVHLQTLAVCWSPFAVLFLDRFLSRGSLKDALGLAGIFVLTMTTGVYFAIFLLGVIVIYPPLCYAFGRHCFQGRALGVLVATGACTAIVLLPVIMPYVRFASEQGLKHRPGQIAAFSVALVDILRVPRWQAVWAGTPLAEASGYRAGFPGVTAVMLVGMFFFFRHKAPGYGRVGWVLTLMCIGSFLLSLGPYLKIHGVSPVRIGGSYIPMPGAIFLMLSAVRAPMRILLYSYLFGAVLCGLGVHALTDRLPPRLQMSVALLLLLALGVEYRPQSWFARESVSVPAPLAISDAYPFLAAEHDTGAVVELPGADENGYRAPLMARYTYGSAGHLRRVVAYHGSVKLPAVERLQRAAERLPNALARNLLRSAGVTRLIVHHGLMERDKAARIMAALDAADYPRLHEGPEAVVFDLGGTPLKQSGP